MSEKITIEITSYEVEGKGKKKYQLAVGGISQGLPLGKTGLRIKINELIATI